MVRVRRERGAEPLESIELDFDRENQLKRKRLVTQSSALADQFASLSATPATESTEKQSESAPAKEDQKAANNNQEEEKTDAGDKH